ncbi:MAG: hypothetical protein R2681_02170 [Pyrinomonadaceae bacterium]
MTKINDEDAIERSAFLKGSNTGYVRLHDQINCLSTTVDVSEPCPWNIYSKATAYSFRRKDYVSGFISDIVLFDTRIIAIGLMQQTIVRSLGDVALQDVDLNNEAVVDLLSVAPSPAKLKTAAVTEKEELQKICAELGVPSKEDHTYVLRAIAFQGYLRLGEIENIGKDETATYGSLHFRNLETFSSDKRRDVLIAFRIIRKHSDGSVSIIWKQLQNKKAPMVTRVKV